MAKILIAGRIQAEHSDAQAFNKDLELLCERRVAIVAKLRSEAEYLYKAMKKQFAFSTKDASGEPYLPKLINGCEPIRLVRRWENKASFDHVTKYYGVACGDDIPEVVCSVVYYRQNGLLLHLAGTGSHVIKHNQECNDHEWDAIKQGVVPEKFAA